jgi:hypothetical protein
MKRITIPLAALCGITLLLVVGASAQDQQPNQTVQSISRAKTPVETGKDSDASAGDSASEVEGLKRRVEELENQNRALAQSLADINAKLSALARPETASAAPTPVAQSVVSAASKPSTSPKQEDNDPHVRWSEIIGEENRIKLYGFLRLDLDFDSQRPSNTQIPFFITSPDARASGTDNGDYSRVSRATSPSIPVSPRTTPWTETSRRAGARATAPSTSATESRRARTSSSVRTTCVGGRTTKDSCAA